MLKRGIPSRNIDPNTGRRQDRQDKITPPSLPAPAPAPTAEVDTDQSNSFRTLASFLSSIGLSDLFSYVNGRPSGWLWDQIVGGVTNVEELLIGLQQTDSFKQRFPIIDFQQQQNAQGIPTRVMTPSEVLTYESEVTNAFRRAGLPSWFYDNPVEDVQARIQSGLSPEAIVERVDTAYSYVVNAPVEVRQKFEEFYGVANSDAALAAYILDPEKTIASLEKAQRTAYTAGIGQQYQIPLSQQQAQTIAEMPLTEAGITQGLQDVAQQSGLYQESVGETTDLTTETGVASVFGADVEATTALERRATQRQTVGQGSQGGAVLTQTGVIGL